MMTKFESRNWEEVFPRLVAANFDVTYDEEDGKLYLESPQYCEEGDGPTGVHFYGERVVFEVLVPPAKLPEFYNEAFSWYRDAIKEWMGNRLQKQQKDLQEDRFR